MKHTTELRSRIYKRGATVEITQEEYDQRPGCFEVVQKTDEAPSEPERPAQLTRAQLQAKLDDLGIAYKARDSITELQRKLEENVNINPELTIAG